MINARMIASTAGKRTYLVAIASPRNNPETTKAHFLRSAINEARKIFGENIVYGKRDYEILRGADALIIVTEWNEFREPDFDRIKKLLKNPIIFDGRNIYNPSKLREMGFEYYGIGY